ncbi:MAG TPA: TPM domain-containing protein [Micromonosporaceae bacterium]
MTIARAVVAVVLSLAAAMATSLVASPARADRPMRLDTQITDRVDALGARKGEVISALSVLRSQSGLQLFVVYVRSFSGTPAREWAAETARRSDLGREDGLLAVATHDRAYWYSFDQDFALSDEQLADVASIAIEPALAANDWAGAAIGAAQGYGAALAGRPIPPPQIQPGEPDPGGSGTGVLVAGAVVCLLLAAAAAGLAIWLLLVRRRRSARSSAVPGRTPPAGAPEAVAADPLSRLSDDDLSQRANTLLVDADDAIKTSEEELAFAVAQYGAEATRSFTDTVAAAKQEIGSAFQLRQRLDDETPEDPPTRRAMLTEIIQRCEAADRRLDAEAEAFDALRDLEGRLDPAMTEATARRDAAAARLASAQTALDTLRARYADTALRSVADNVEQARERIAFATTALGRAQAAGQGDRSSAAVAVRGAQDAVSQAATLLDSVEKLDADLTRVRGTVDAALADLDGDLAAGRATLAAGGARRQGGAELAGDVARAEQVVAAVRAELAGARPDPVAALRRLNEAGRGLDRALAEVREASQRTARTRSALDQAIIRARAEISVVADYIATRRGAVRREARTRLAEAQRHLDRAAALAEADPEAALAQAQRADALAEQAGELARSDVDQWSMPAGFGGGGGLPGAILGGILLGGILGGGRGGGRGGGLSGGGGWGGWSPGGFGGSSRRGGGGRF